MIGAVGFGVLEWRYGDGDLKRQSLPLPHFVNQFDQLHRIEIVIRLSGGFRRALGVIAGDRKHIVDSQRVQPLQRSNQLLTAVVDAGEVNVGREPASLHEFADANRIMPRRATRIAGDARSDQPRHLRQIRGHLLQLLFGGLGAGHKFHEVAEAARRSALRELDSVKPCGRYFPNSLRTILVPSTIACILANATSRGRWKQPQSGRT